MSKSDSIISLSIGARGDSEGLIDIYDPFPDSVRESLFEGSDGSLESYFKLVSDAMRSLGLEPEPMTPLIHLPYVSTDLPEIIIERLG